MDEGQNWQLIVVDDEEDVHNVTELALRRKKWKKKGFEIAHAKSLKEGKAIISKNPAQYRVAIVDVVMETDTAGLELCQYIRSNCPPSARIVLRTGQPGMAPEEAVLNNYDIDFYMEKTDASPEKLYSVIRSCLRSSEDISTLLAFGRQLQSFTRALQRVTSLEDLLVFMREGIAFLDLKHNASSLFYYDLSVDTPIPIQFSGKTSVESHTVQAKLKGLHETAKPGADISLSRGPAVGFPNNSLVQLFCTKVEEPGKEEGQAGEVTVGNGGLYAEIVPEYFSEKAINDFSSDARLFIENWRIAYSTLRLQERLAKERMLREQMYFERMQSIATMVTGVAHEMNTPLGVANTARAMVVDLAQQLAGENVDPTQRKEMAADLTSSADLLTKNLVRAQDLIKNFKQLSASQLSDHRVLAPIGEVARTCVDTMGPVLKKQSIQATVVEEPNANLEWDGYPGHLSQVLVNFIQNTCRYGYDEGQSGGKIEITLSNANGDKGPMLKLVYRDFGKGIAAEMMPRMFEPFVTSGRNKGGTGLGLAISHNIVTNLLGGSIRVDSKPGQGATFTLLLPKTAPVQGASVQPTALSLRK
ncbi:MAG: hybrid sensor histidine kinase/response regulator [Deltaproteobacteria bacterium]|nr:hybrid sensor histidine kinase/response regulator [Deltaproteobacteria bacterium]